jgi:hypothetical protein
MSAEESGWMKAKPPETKYFSTTLSSSLWMVTTPGLHHRSAQHSTAQQIHYRGSVWRQQGLREGVKT